MEDHLCHFENASLLHQYTDGIKCRVFLNTLADSVQRWFNRLPLSSIHSFKDFKEVFLHQFFSNKKYQKIPLNLFTMNQKSRKTLREYLHRFNQVVWEEPSTSLNILTSTFTQELLDGEFFRSLRKKSSPNYQRFTRKEPLSTSISRRLSSPTETTWGRLCLQI